MWPRDTGYIERELHLFMEIVRGLHMTGVVLD
jgi:hypothetical protein